MIIFIAAFICIGLGTALYFMLLMADGRRLQERLHNRRPSFVPEVREEPVPLVAPDYDAWMAPPLGGGPRPGLGGHRAFYPTTPTPPASD
jgi:hypothetical protein